MHYTQNCNKKMLCLENKQGKCVKKMPKTCKNCVQNQKTVLLQKISRDGGTKSVVFCLSDNTQYKCKWRLPSLSFKIGKQKYVYQFLFTSYKPCNSLSEMAQKVAFPALKISYHICFTHCENYYVPWLWTIIQQSIKGLRTAFVNFVNTIFSFLFYKTFCRRAITDLN